jgi:nanoRNase/pAp phosphatase (c-di-AMP/oligoRNAs hydrolase)
MFGGGGHRQAAGFSSDASIDEITELIRQGFTAQRAAASA